MTDGIEEDGSPGEDKRGPGRPKQYEKWSNTERGAPKLVVRVDPEVKEWVESRSEKPRPYIERLVRADKAAALTEQGLHKPLVGDSNAALPLSGEAEQAAEA